MEMVETIKELCKQKGTSIAKLEKDLGFGNGSISKSTTNYMRSDRLLAVSKYLGVPMERLLGITEDSDMAAGAEDMILLQKIRKLNRANRALLESMVDSMISQQESLG